MAYAVSWLARSAQMTPAADDWLTPAERAYADAQRFTKRHSEYRIARYAAKSALARALDLPRDAAGLARIEIRHDPSGAPYACHDGERIAWQLSLSDRADWAVCLVGNGIARIGCDLELVEPRTPAFVADFLTPAEQAYVDRQTNEDARALAANLIWSAKESALKVLTTGLRRDTRSVEVTVGPRGGEWGQLRVAAAEGVSFPGWWRRRGSFVLTVASAESVAPPALLEPSAHLDTAIPSHGWLPHPLRESSRVMPRSSASIR